jgi:hypothetical protein
MPSPGLLLGIVAVVLALAGTAAAAGNLKLGDFDGSSRNRLAGTGVIQYAAQSYDTGTSAKFDEIHTFFVKCELAKKATSGGFKWTDATPPKPGNQGTTDVQPDYQVLDQYPNGGGYVVRMYIRPGGSAEHQHLAVYANCVKSRQQNGVPPT